MRFCPFCSAENIDDATACGACSRRLPPLPPRRQRNSDATGILATRPMRATDASVVLLPGKADPVPAPVVAVAHVVTAPGLASLVAVSDLAPVAAAEMPAPALPAALSPALAPSVVPNQALRAALTPSPTAIRRDAAPPETRDTNAPARRRYEASVPPPVPPREKSGPVMAPGAAPPTASFAVPLVAPVVAPDAVQVAAPILPSDASLGAGRGAESSVHYSLAVAARNATSSGIEPPPTRVFRSEAMADRPFVPPQLLPVPEIPEPGVAAAAKYTVGFARARWQRRKAIKVLNAEVKQDTAALDQVLGALGSTARTVHVAGRVFNSENIAINTAEQRRADLLGEQQGLDGRTAEESAKFTDIETERTTKLNEAERVLEDAKRENETLEGQRRSARDKRKEVERRQKAYLKAAEDRDNDSATTGMGETRSQLRRAAESHRREAAELEPERQDLDRRLAGIEKPLIESQARLDAAKAEYDSAKRSLHDAREGHGHRLAELDAEKKRKLRDIAACDNEITRRLVTLGTLVNLNRVEDPAFVELYARIDRIRGAITARTTEVEKLTAERSAYHRESLIRGAVVIGGAIVAFIALIVLLRAIF
ncbi:MAG: hypothetical protein KBG15_11770 [Kofleriaceae bacterium]|nr:hypothetical protein [Kofleriaceae bacterium]